MKALVLIICLAIGRVIVYYLIQKKKEDLNRTTNNLESDTIKIDKLRSEFNERYDDLKRMLDEFEEEHATVCDEDGRRFKVVIDGVTYYADEPKLKTIHSKTGEVVIGGFYKEESK